MSKPGTDAKSSIVDNKNQDAVDQLTAGLAGLSTSDTAAQVFAKTIKTKGVRNVIVLTGAGISVSAGILDFRTPGTGLYDNLQKYDLPEPEAVFSIDYFKQNPKPFCTLAKELYPGNFAPTPGHSFIRLLHDKGILLRNYTQNIDGLEFIAGLPDDKVVQAHGGFQQAHCVECKSVYDQAFCKAAIFADQIPRCTSDGCSGLVKPDIVFFGEALPDRFASAISQDFPQCDCLIVMGTSLQVQPFASLVNRVADDVPRLLVNREKAGEAASVKDIAAQLGLDPAMLEGPRGQALMAMFGGGSGFDFTSERDVFLQGDCDDGVRALATSLGWHDEFDALVKQAAATAPATSTRSLESASKAVAAAAGGGASQL